MCDTVIKAVESDELSEEVRLYLLREQGNSILWAHLRKGNWKSFVALPGILCHLCTWVSPCPTRATASGVTKAAEAAKAANISAERLKFLFATLKPAEDLDLLPVMSK